MLTFKKNKNNNQIIRFNDSGKKLTNKLKKLSKLRKIFKFKKLSKNKNLVKNNAIRKFNFLIFNTKTIFNYL